MATTVVVRSTAQFPAVLGRRDTDTPREGAPHRFRRPKSAASSNRDHGVGSLRQVTPSQFDARPLQIRTRRFADVGEEHSDEMPGAHGSAASQLGDRVFGTGIGLDGLLRLSNSVTLRPGSQTGEAN